MRRATSQLACTLLAARRAMSTKRVGVLVKDGHAAWPPRLQDCDADLINAATSEELHCGADPINYNVVRQRSASPYWACPLQNPLP